ncbi:hypothetical protein CDAR_438641 [Caerostris darwini]|uniref:Uncharacterized protein n=1 Tax=Caerostris darwini TaxID=1538125 RepID=A0AAV4X0V2_9ARAC|nr:hypothetical protein CDAR_438641 [Caerostris darwini]
MINNWLLQKFFNQASKSGLICPKCSFNAILTMTFLGHYTGLLYFEEKIYPLILFLRYFQFDSQAYSVYKRNFIKHRKRMDFLNIREEDSLEMDTLDNTVERINYPHITTQSRNGHKKRLVGQLKRRFNNNGTCYIEELRKVMVASKPFIILFALIVMFDISNARIEYDSRLGPGGPKGLTSSSDLDERIVKFSNKNLKNVTSYVSYILASCALGICHLVFTLFPDRFRGELRKIRSSDVPHLKFFSSKCLKSDWMLLNYLTAKLQPSDFRDVVEDLAKELYEERSASTTM